MALILLFLLNLQFTRLHNKSLLWPRVPATDEKKYEIQILP